MRVDGLLVEEMMHLNPWAQAFVEQTRLAYHERVTRIYPDGRWETQPDRPVYEFVAKKEITGDTCNGQSGEMCIDFHKYTFPNGRVVFERTHSLEGVPCMGLKTVMPDGKEHWIRRSKWTYKEIKKDVNDFWVRRAQENQVRLKMLGQEQEDEDSEE